jgi:hypothetical protein
MIDIDQIANQVVAKIKDFISPTMSQVHVPGAEDVVRKFAKDEVNYREDGDAKRCGDCASFQPPDACEVVEGEVGAGATCDRWRSAERFYVPIQKDTYGDVLLFPVSTFYRDGKKRKFTAAQAEEMVRNFKDNVLGRTDGKLPVNAEHERWRGRIGYVVDMAVRDGQPFVKLEESKSGVLDGFDYISPEIRWLWTHPFTGAEHKNVLMGVAATNYPFLLGKTAIAKALVWGDGEWFQAKAGNIDLSKLPAEITVTPQAVCVVGSKARGEGGDDVDVLFRFEVDKDDGRYFRLRRENIDLPIRRALGLGKDFHPLDNPQGPHGEALPLYDLVLRRCQRVEKAAVAPGRRYTVMKPSMAGSTEFFSTDELWDKWVSGKTEEGKALLGSPKVDGFRSVLSWDGDSLTVWFEDAKDSKRFPAVAKVLKGKSPFVIEGEFTAKAGDEWVARTELAGVAAGKTEATPHFWLYDLLYDGGDVSGEPFEDRLARLRKLGLPKSHFAVLEQRAVKDKRGLASVGRWAASEPLSEGLFVREADAPYAFGSTDTAAKWKTVFEIKVAVLDVVRRSNGYTYRAGLRDGGKFKNSVSYKGEEYADLGYTFVTKTRQGSVGDTLNVRIEELLLLSDGRLTWGKPTVVGPDKSRAAYTAAQAISLAKRGRVFKQEVAKANEEGGEGGPRASAATKNWEENWQNMLPKSGSGRFVYQHHWRGLSEDEAGLSDEQLLKLERGASVHGDIRLEGPGALWGWAVFLGESKENRGGDKLVTGKQENLQLAPKLPQPRGWLRVGRGKGTAIEPGKPGSTARTWSKFFAVDEGAYRLGVARVHFVEVFLNGKHLKGRYLFQYAPLGGSRKWIVDKPKDQRPFAETHGRDRIIKELKRKGQKWLFWGDGKGKPEIIDVAKAQAEDSSEFVHEATFSRFDDHARIASGIVLQPDEPDAQGHVMRAAEIEAAAHRYAERMRLDLHHDRDAEPDEARVVESWVQRESVTWRFEMDGETRETHVPAGAWCASVQFGERLWSQVLSGEICGFSPKGWGVLTPVAT